MKEEMTGRELLKLKAESLTEADVEEVLEYINLMESMRRARFTPDPLDEAIVGLLCQSIDESRKRAEHHFRRPILKH